MTLDSLPMPPSANALYRNITRFRGKGSGRVKTKEYLAFESAMRTWGWSHPDQLALARAFVENVKRKNRLLHLDLTFYFNRPRIITKDERPKRLDTSNRIKAMHDALADLLDFDDCIIWSGAFFKGQSPNNLDYTVAKFIDIDKNAAFSAVIEDRF